MNENKDKFSSNFGFLMASIGSAVGLGNIWGFPYKMGMNGGFTFLIVYLLLIFTVGLPLMMGEIALGRKSEKGAIQAYKSVSPKFKFVGWFNVIAPFLLLCFYVVFGGYILKYLIANFKNLFSAGSSKIAVTHTATFFEEFISAGAEPMVYAWIFLAITLTIVALGVSGGIEKFSNFAMPTLTIMLIIIVIRACTLEGAGEGLAFIFKPDASKLEGMGFLEIFAAAGSQMFFSLSLSSGAIIAYGSYLSKNSNIEKNATIITISDAIISIFAALAVMPAVFAFGLEPQAGPGLLFVSLQAVFNDMGTTGPLFASIFYLLVLFAALTSSIAMTEGFLSSILDAQEAHGKQPNRKLVSALVYLATVLGASLISYDALGNSNLHHPFGLSTWLDFFDLLAEGILMPLGGLCLAVMLGWFNPKSLDDEYAQGSKFKSKKFYNFCIKYVAPPVLLLVVVVQLNAFFGFIS